MAKFKKGISGNLAGRPKGTKSAPNLLRDGLMQMDDLSKVIKVIVDKALAGDLSAASLLLDRCVPKLRPSADITDESELAEATAAAKMRGARSEGFMGLTLDDLVVSSYSVDLDT